MRNLLFIFALVLSWSAYAQLPDLPVSITEATPVDTVEVEERAAIRAVKSFNNPPAKGMILISGSTTENGKAGSFWVFPNRAGIGTPVLTNEQLNFIASQVGTDQTRIVEDSILVYSNGTNEVGRDTLRGIGGTQQPLTYTEGLGININGQVIDAEVTPDVLNTAVGAAQIAAQNYAAAQILNLNAQIQTDISNNSTEDRTAASTQAAVIAADTANILRQYADENDQTRDFIPKTSDFGLNEFRAQLGKNQIDFYTNGDSKFASRSEFFRHYPDAFESRGLPVREVYHQIINTSFSDCFGFGAEVFTGPWSGSSNNFAFNGNSLICAGTGNISFTVGAGSNLSRSIVYYIGDITISFIDDGTEINSISASSPTATRLEIPYSTGDELLIESTGNLEILGLFHKTDLPNAINIYNLSINGHKTTSFTALYENWRTLYSEFDPELVAIGYGTNDVNENDLTKTSFNSRYQIVVDYWESRGAEVVAIAPGQKRLNAVQSLSIDEINEIIFDISVKDSLAFISHNSIYGSRATTTDAQPVGVLRDGIHYNDNYGEENVNRIVGFITGRESIGGDNSTVFASALFSAGNEIVNSGDWLEYTETGLQTGVWRASNTNGPPAGTEYFYKRIIEWNSSNYTVFADPIDLSVSNAWRLTVRAGVASEWEPFSKWDEGAGGLSYTENPITTTEIINTATASGETAAQQSLRRGLFSRGTSILGDPNSSYPPSRLLVSSNQDAYPQNNPSSEVQGYSTLSLLEDFSWSDGDLGAMIGFHYLPNRKSAYIAAYRDGVDSDYVGLEFAIHNSPSNAADPIPALRINRLGRLESPQWLTQPRIVNPAYILGVDGTTGEARTVELSDVADNVGDGDAGGLKITNMAEGTDVTDATTYGQLNNRVDPNARILSGNALPEGTVTAPAGNIYVSIAGGTATVWVKGSGTGNTGWVQL